MKKMLGVIQLDHENDLLKELTYFRCVAATPFASRYRLIDFVLSNMVTAQVHEVALFARKKYRSLMDHLGTGQPWDLNRKNGGFFILPPDWNDPTDRSLGDLQHFHNNRDFFMRSQADYVLISGSTHLCTIDYQAVFEQHLQTNADVTLIYHPDYKTSAHNQNKLKLQFNKKGAVQALINDQQNPHLFMNMYIISKKVLLELVDYCISNHKSDLLLDGVFAHLDHLAIHSYAYDGYHAVIDSVESYYKYSMELLQDINYQKLFLQANPIFSKIKDEPPTQYKKGAKVSHSLIANGCIVEGTVKNSILFSGVHVQKGAIVENSIIMQRCTIQHSSQLSHVILDKNIQVTPYQRRKGTIEAPYLIAKSQVI
ncbi:glucose-1-phosphate adenylyltransferase subunit GlgD [Alkalihalobacillus sp. 1P02AB]|uniref:glucose-1-phosphate adenylyltransferase subunit GlgD n=1 Tax=Alkalihalobacillus sp. 1P02AB TaxID=3132260 RepID=UPI0039A5D9BB